MSAFNINLKRQLIDATDSVRKKFNSIRQEVEKEHTSLNKFYEPITTPLKDIVETTKKRVGASKRVTPLQTFISPIVGNQASTPYGTPHQTPHHSPKQTPRKFTGPMMEYPVDESPFIYTPSSSFSHQNIDETIVPVDKPEEMDELESIYKSENDEVESVNNESDDNMDDDQNTDDEVLQTHLTNLASNNPKYDIIYGVRKGLDDKHYIGKHRVEFNNRKIKLYSDKKKVKEYAGSANLYDMMFLRDVEPSDSVRDMVAYRDILNTTRAIYNHYDLRRGVNESETKKFKYLIRTIIPSTAHLRQKKKLGGKINLSNKLYTQKNVEYVYWNNIHELIARLRLLWASKMAGHTGHDNEILSIIEELREEGVIY